MKPSIKIPTVVAFALALSLAATSSMAMSRAEAELKVKESGIVIESFMSAVDSDAPRTLLQRAIAVIIMPDMLRGGFILGAKYGQGIVSVRQKDGSFSPPAFMNMYGGNIGLQIGAESMDLVLVIMKQPGLDGILKDHLEVGVNASVAAGPIGRGASAKLNDFDTEADIYSYSRTKGAYIGAVVEGAKFSYESDSTMNYYGKAMVLRDVVLNGKAVPPASARQLMGILQRYGTKPK